MRKAAQFKLNTVRVTRLHLTQDTKAYISINIASLKMFSNNFITLPR